MPKIGDYDEQYEVGDIIGEVEALLAAKPETERLTIAVDETIDYVRSEQVTRLLERFSKEIKEGKLNFVFFRSGQKFDMLGIDNYDRHFIWLIMVMSTGNLLRI